MLDIHAHLYWESYDADRDEMIQRAFDAGIEKMICVGTEPGDNPKAVAVAERYENVYVSVGLHPHFFDEHIKKEFPISNFQFPINSQFSSLQIKNAIEELRKVAQSSKKVVAIGECGLDYFVRSEQRTVNNEQGATNNKQGTGGSQQETITEEQKAIQKEGFIAQMEVARELGVPLIIHTRPSAGTMDAYEDLFDILKNHSPASTLSSNRGESLITHHLSSFILHCYQGDTEITKKFLELPNVYFSFAGSITYLVKKALIGTKDDSSEVVKLVPLERLFVETDAPFLAPVPHRGERNEPVYALATAERVCELKGCGREELDHALRSGFHDVFDK